MRIILSTLMVLILPGVASGQFERIIEELSVAGVPESEIEEWADRLSDLAANPIRINSASEEDIAQLPFVDMATARLLAAARPFHSIEDLGKVPGIGGEAMTFLEPLIDFGTGLPTRAARSTRILISQNINTRLELSRGFESRDGARAFAGSPLASATRIRLSNGSMSAGWIGAKMSGEQIGWNPSQGRLGPEHTALYFEMRRTTAIRHVVLGDHRMGVGTGILIGRSARIRSASDPVRVVSSLSNGLTPHFSTARSEFFRGIGAEVAPSRRVTLSASVSARHLDASVGFTEDGQPFARSVGGTNRYRTGNEIARKRAVREQAGIVSARLATESVEVGLAAFHRELDTPLVRSTQPYQMFFPEGVRARGASASGRYSLRPLALTGELAYAGGWGGTGALSMIIPTASAVIAFRSFDKNYYAPFARTGAARSSALRSERGWYLGGTMNLDTRTSAAFLIDHYRYEWLRHGIHWPSDGSDLRIAIRHRPRRWIRLEAEARRSVTTTGTVYADPDMRQVRGIGERQRSAARLSATYDFSSILTFRARGDIVETDRSNGTLLAFDMRFLPTPGLILEGRIAQFHTDDFDSRVAAYEYDVPYAFSVPSLYGRGSRSYLMVMWRPNRVVDLACRIARTLFLDRHSIGSGHDLVASNRVTDFAIALRVRR
jgi:hypothetical protein